MTWTAQMRALVFLNENYGTNTGWSDWSWTTKNVATSLLSVYFLMDPDLYTFVLLLLIVAVTKMNNTQRSKPTSKYINPYWRTQSFSISNMDLRWSLDNLLCQDLSSYCKRDNTSGNNIL